MSRFCFVVFSFLLYTRVGIECSVANTGTVLFSSTDVHRQCWHPEEIAVLTTRMVFQDILPKANNLEIDNNDYVDDIVEYFKLMFEVVQKSIKGRARHVAMLALSDLIGGYLQHVVLPKGRLAFYAGLIDYYSMEKLIQFYEELKWFLRTNGQGWALPLKLKNSFDIEPIELSTESIKGNKSCCRNLIYYQRSGIKRVADKETSKIIYFPMPFFDAKVRPSAIAVPFRRFALRNIESKRAAHMVMKYYISVHNCMNDLYADKTTIETFRDKLFTWIEKNVMPKLNDNKFYSAFGGILRVRDSLKMEGARIQTAAEPTQECVENEGEQELGTIPGGETTSRSSVLLIIMLVTIFVWFILGTLFICYRIRSNSRKANVSKRTVSTDSSSSFGSSGGWSSKRTVDTCKCCTTTEKSTELHSSFSSEFEKVEDVKDKTTVKSIFTKSSKKGQTLKRICLCDEPPVIEPKQSMKVLPSIPEMSEHSSSKRVDWKSKLKKLSVGEPASTSSADDFRSRTKFPSKIRVCLPMLEDIDVSVCPDYTHKATSASSFRSKSSSGQEIGLQKIPSGQDEMGQMTNQEFEVIKDRPANTNESTTDETSDNPGNSPHIYACHSSLTGNYTKDQKFSTEKPYIFGYDFQTSTSSEQSDEDSDARTSTTK